MNKIEIKHLPHPEDEKILEMLENFEENSKNGFLHLDSADLVFVISDSEAHQKIQGSINRGEGKAYSTGEIEHNGIKFSEYSINSSFFE